MTDPRLDELDLRRLVATYADGVTRRDWVGLQDLFLPDAVLHLDLVDREVRDLSGPAEITGFIDTAVARFDFFEFVALNVLVTVPADGEADRARIRTFMCEIRHQPAGDDGPEGWSTAYGLYQDVAERSEGTWRFAERTYRSLARTDPAAAPGGVVLPFPDLPPAP